MSPVREICRDKDRFLCPEEDRLFLWVHIQVQAEAQAARMAGLTEAETMKAKGYSEKDILQAEVQKAYAAGLGQMGSNGGGGALGDIAGLGATLGAMSGIMGMTKEAMAPMFGGQSQNTAPTAPAAPAAPRSVGWDCVCGEKGITSMIDELQKAAIEQDFPAAHELCRKALLTLEKRNRLCKLNR